MKLPHIHISDMFSRKALARESWWTLIGHDPHVDWVLMVLTALTLCLLLIGIGAASYFRANPLLLGSAKTVANTKRISFDPQALAHVLGQFDQHEGERAALLKGYSGPGDPSL